MDLNEIEDYVPDSLLKSVKGRANCDVSTKGILPDSITDESINAILANTQADLNCQM